MTPADKQMNQDQKDLDLQKANNIATQFKTAQMVGVDDIYIIAEGLREEREKVYKECADIVDGRMRAVENESGTISFEELGVARNLILIAWKTPPQDGGK